ncbi:MAG: hypothetical protein RLZZ156_1220 [Deinococcota bacterium]|jgi:hypothetical protein
MSFKLEIRLDRPDGVYIAGDTVSGVVTIHDSDGGRGKIQLVREWRAHGRGHGDHGSRAEVTIAETWGAGISEVPFSFPMPDGPFTYRGTNTNLDWYVRAETGGIFGKTKAETDFIFGAVPNMPSVDFGPGYIVPVAYGKPTTGNSAFGIIAVAVFGLVFAGMGFFIFSAAQPPIIVVIPFGAIFLGVFGFIAYSLLRNNLAQARLGTVSLEIEPTQVQPGQSIQIRFATTTKADVDLSKIEVKLVQNEFYATGSGTNRSTHTVPILQEMIPISEARSLRAGEKLEFAVEIPIPADAATTFSAHDNKVTWQVQITLPIKGWSDWQYLQDITVRP